MSRSRLLLALLLCSTVNVAMADVKEDIVRWRRDFHQHPELGNRETRTAGIVARHLKKLGLEVETGVAHTGVVGLLRGAEPGPMLAIRADMDALPVTENGDLPFKSTVKTTYNNQTVGVMHACGHDGHTAMLMGLAQTLATRRASLHGSVLFVFQPAEEGAPEGEEGGAELMLKEGLFSKHKPDAVVGMHVLSNWTTGQIAVRAGSIMAESDRFRIVVSGRQTHGSKPWSGVDPIVTASQIVGALQTIVSRRVDVTRAPAVVSVGSFHGGVRYNIIPDKVEMIGTIRTFETDMRDGIYADIRRIAQNTAEANDASAEVEIWQHTTVLKNDVALTDRLRVGLERAVGRDHVIEARPQTVAEDFAALSDQVPGMYFFVGATPPDRDPAKAAANHSPDFFLDENALDVGYRAMLEVVDEFFATAK